MGKAFFIVKGISGLVLAFLVWGILSKFGVVSTLLFVLIILPIILLSVYFLFAAFIESIRKYQFLAVGLVIIVFVIAKFTL